MKCPAHNFEIKTWGENTLVYEEDVLQCLYYLKNGEDFTFVIDGNTLCQFNDMSGHDTSNVHIVLTPEWYELTYCSNHWNVDTLGKELAQFADCVKKLDEDFISTKFTVVWR